MTIASYPRQDLRRNRWLDRGAHALFAATFTLILLGGDSGSPLWRAGALLTVPFLAMMAFIAVATLPQGPTRFREFRLYLAMAHGVSGRAVTRFYLPMAAIGMVCVAKLWW
jgi:hypothetical protein